MKSQILKLRKQIYTNLKTRAYALENHSSELDEYLKDQSHYAKRDFQFVEMDHIKKMVMQAQLIYLGDFHTFDQNIRNVLRIIRFITESDTKCILALEMIHSDHQIYIDAFLENHLTELEFLESINYHNSWRFPWSHYKLIFEIVKEHKLKVIGLNTEGSLNERDHFAANKLNDLFQKNSTSRVLTLYGELHITPNKIPALVKNLQPKARQIIIHQNLDEVYWELVKRDKEQGLVAFSDDEYCLITAPPWIKYESMIYWYENVCDDPDFDIHEYIIENEKKFFSDDTKETFFGLCCEIIKNLGLSIPESDIEDFNLYDHTNLEYIEEKLEETLDSHLLEFYKYLMATNRSFKFPHSNTFYCSSYSMNRISYLAGIHIFRLHFQSDQLATLTQSKADLKYVSLAMDAMFAYFFSKIINPHRKCDLYLDIQKSYKESEFLIEKQFLKLSLNVLDQDLKKINIENIKLETIYEAAILNGHLFGEYLYRKMVLDKKAGILLTYFSDFEVSVEYFEKLKHKLIPQKEFRSHQKRYF